MSNGVSKADFPAQMNRVEPVPLLPHEVVGVIAGAEYATKGDIPMSTRYVGMETTEYLTADTGIRYRWNGTDWESRGIVYTTITHAADGVLAIDLNASQFTAVNLEANVTELHLSGGRVGETYRVSFTQDATATAHTLTIAPAYPVTGTAVVAGDIYLYTTLDSTYPIRRRVYQVVDNYTTDTFDTDLANGDLVNHMLFPDAVLPLLSYQPGNIDVLIITVLQPNVYVVVQEFPNM